MIRAIVVDDEYLINEYICRLLKEAGLEVKGYTNPYEAIENLKIYKPHVLFLDIEMPEISGLQLAEKVHKMGYQCEIVFITAHNQYAVNAFEVNAIDYLLKPIMKESVNRAIERIKKRMYPVLQNEENDINKKIRIYLFGKMSLYIGEQKKTIHWMTAKSAEIFAFMLLHKDENEVSKWRLMEEIWPDKDREKADINIRSTISRLNKTFRENDMNISMLSTGNGYTLHIMEKDIEIDAMKLENIVLNITEINDENFCEYEKAIFSYKYTLLESINNEWCYTFRENYNRYFITGAKKLVKYYERVEAEPIKILRIIEFITKYEPYDEKIREKALQLYYKTEGRKGAEKYYEKYYELIKNDLQVEPNKSMKEFYKSIMN